MKLNLKKKQLFKLGGFMSVLAIAGLIASMVTPLVGATPASTIRVNTATGGGEAWSAGSGIKDISDDGNLILFNSGAYNLVSGDWGTGDDLFIKNKTTDNTERVNIATCYPSTTFNEGLFGAKMSADGRYVVFASRTGCTIGGKIPNPVHSYIFLRDRQAGTTELISKSTGSSVFPDASSNNPDVSNDGRFVSFHSGATDLVASDTNSQQDVFVYDRKLSATKLVSKSIGGTQGNDQSVQARISCDGRFIAFASWATNLVASDTNGQADIFLVDQLGDDIVDLTIAGNGSSSQLSDITCDADYLVFTSSATNLVSGDTNGTQDVFKYDRNQNAVTRVSLTNAGGEQNGNSGSGSISADGRYVTFDSDGTNIVSGDTNAKYDVFLRDITSGTTERQSVSSGGTQANDYSGSPRISKNANYVAYTSGATNLISGDYNTMYDVFLTDTGVAPIACY